MFWRWNKCAVDEKINANIDEKQNANVNKKINIFVDYIIKVNYCVEDKIMLVWGWKNCWCWPLVIYKIKVYVDYEINIGLSDDKLNKIETK